MSTISTPSSLPNETLERYVSLIMEGKSDEEIRTLLKLPPKKFKENLPFFLAYFRDKMRNKIVAKSMLNRISDLYSELEPLKERFMECLRSGLSLEKAARAINIPLPVITDHWYLNKTFRIEAEMAIEFANIDVEQALFKRAVGFEHDEEYSSDTESSGTTSEGIPYSNKSTTTHKKRRIVYGDVRAQETWLYNRSPDRWQAGGLPSDRDERGTIMTLIDEMTAADKEENDAEGKTGEEDECF